MELLLHEVISTDLPELPELKHHMYRWKDAGVGTGSQKSKEKIDGGRRHELIVTAATK